MEVEQMLIAHSVLIKAFLGFLVGGLIASFVVKTPKGFKKMSFIYTMIFQAIATMIAFAGLVAVFTGDLGWSLTTIVMVIVWAILMYVEIKKHKLVKVANLENEDTFKLLKGAFIKVASLQIAIVTVMDILMILKAKGVISI